MSPKLNFHFSEYTALVINPQGKLRELHCPFKVHCIQTIPDIPINSWAYVEMTSENKAVGLLYLINGKWYSFEFFVIVIHF